MKKLLFSLLLIAFSLPTLFAQNPAIREFIREHRKGEENVALRVPGWLIGLASNIGLAAADDEEERAIFSLAQEFGTIRMVTFDSNDFNTSADIKGVLKAIESHHGYERWASVRAASGELVQLSVNEKKGEIREIVAIITEAEEHRTIFAHFRTSLTAEELGDVMNKLIE
jgi:hypothetical protein